MKLNNNNLIIQNYKLVHKHINLNNKHQYNKYYKINQIIIQMMIMKNK
jgi:hypothetical protein